jgi:hypothetical protein
MTDEPENPQKEEIDAIKAIARTRDGLLLHRYPAPGAGGVIDIQEASALRAERATQFGPRPDAAHGRGIE